MFTFHKPKVFRSGSGCCICKAKSSSSRFTDSKRYEHVFERCFDLSAEENDRTGEICNACVLLVKRFLKLPEGSTRNWNHVVDARSGPGIKSLARKKSVARNSSAARSNTPDLQIDSTPEKVLKKKHVYKSKKKQAAPVRQRNPSFQGLAVSDFLDTTLWAKEKICCGTIFRGPFGETVIDARFLTPCSNRNNSNSAMRCLKSEMEMEAAKRLHEVTPEVKTASGHNTQELVTATTKVVTTPVVDVDDEGFFDKNVASPLSAASSSRSVSGASESGTTSPPPNVEEEEEDLKTLMEMEEDSEEEIDDVEEAT